MYKICPQTITKKKRSPVFISIYVLILAAVFSLPKADESFDWAKFAIIFGVTGLLSVGSNFVGTRKYMRYAEIHTIEVAAAGLKSYELDTVSVLPWSKVTSVKVKNKNGEVTKLTLKTSHGTIDLTQYENLPQLCNELKQFISPGLWR